jgi:hypothetical protein
MGVTGTLSDEHRRHLVMLADRLIPGDETMPAPSDLDIGGTQLAVVLEARPELSEPLVRALDAVPPEPFDPPGWLEELRSRDGEAWEAVVVAVVGGYYVHAEVHRALGYEGQEPTPVFVGGFPDYMSEGLLERVYERGPRYRPTPPPSIPR